MTAAEHQRDWDAWAKQCVAFEIDAQIREFPRVSRIPRESTTTNRS